MTSILAQVAAEYGTIAARGGLAAWRQQLGDLGPGVWLAMAGVAAILLLVILRR
jgi:hypothetical protein